MKINQIIHSYLKALYYINNKLRHKHSKYSTLDPYIQHRVGMDLEIAKRIIERELVYTAIYSGRQIPLLRNRKSRSNIYNLVTDTNKIQSNLTFQPIYTDEATIAHNLSIRYHKLFKHILFGQVVSIPPYKFTISHTLPWLTFSSQNISKFYRTDV